MSDDLRHRLGRLGEDLAAAHLERRGYEVVARNHRTRYGEIDLIGYDRHTLVFAEVKTRRAGSGAPWDALGPRSATRCARWPAPGSRRRPTGRAAPSCASTRSAW